MMKVHIMVDETFIDKSELSRIERLECLGFTLTRSGWNDDLLAICDTYIEKTFNTLSEFQEFIKTWGYMTIYDDDEIAIVVLKHTKPRRYYD